MVAGLAPMRSAWLADDHADPGSGPLFPPVRYAYRQVAVRQKQDGTQQHVGAFRWPGHGLVDAAVFNHALGPVAACGRFLDGREQFAQGRFVPGAGMQSSLAPAGTS